MTEEPPRNPVVISIRAEERQRDLIDLAAEHLGCSREGFMLEAACREAEDVLLDQVFFLLEDERFSRFQSLVENPPSPTDRLRSLLLTKAAWE